MVELINVKLTPNIINGAEGCNNKFNDVIKPYNNTGMNYLPLLLKSIYLSNMQDKNYEHIMDQACHEEATTFQEVQSSILRNYSSVVGEKRSAPPYIHKQLVNNMNSSHHVQFEPNVSV